MVTSLGRSPLWDSHLSRMVTSLGWSPLWDSHLSRTVTSLGQSTCVKRPIQVQNSHNAIFILFLNLNNLATCLVQPHNMYITSHTVHIRSDTGDCNWIRKVPLCLYSMTYVFHIKAVILNYVGTIMLVHCLQIHKNPLLLSLDK